MTPEACFAPLDFVRAQILGAFARAGGRRLLADRGLRVATSGVVAVAGSLFVTCTAPGWLLMASPVLLGIPHLMADVRYLVVQPGLHRRTVPVLLVLALALVDLRRPHVAVGLVAGLLTIAFSPATVARRLGAASVWLVVLVVCARHQVLAGAVLAYAHNLLALGIWLVWAAHSRSASTPVLLAFGGAAAALLAGAAEPVWAVVGAFTSPTLGADLPMLGRTLAPWASAAAGPRWVALFAFAQSVHYTIWLRVIPDERRARPGVRSFASSYRALVADLGTPAVFGFACASVAMVAFACFDLAAAKGTYFRLAAFHGYLELALALGWLTAKYPTPTRMS